MASIAVAPFAELHGNTPYRVSHDGIDVVVVRQGDAVYAIEDRCSHADVALSDGDVDGCFIECWMHGSAFDMRTGQPTSPPATKPVDTFPVSITDHDGTPTVFVEIG